MFRAMGQSDHRQRRLHVFLPLGFGQVRQQQRQFHVPLRRKHGHQIIKLEHEADVPCAPRGQPAVGQLIEPFARDADCAFGRRSRPPIKFNRVLLPEPTAPSTPGIRRSEPANADPPEHECPPNPGGNLLHILDADQRAISRFVFAHSFLFLTAVPSIRPRVNPRPRYRRRDACAQHGVVPLRIAHCNGAAFGAAILDDEHDIPASWLCTALFGTITVRVPWPFRRRFRETPPLPPFPAGCAGPACRSRRAP